MMVAVMKGWTAQWYRYEPADLNVYENEAPGAMDPLLKAPSLAVTVWSTWPVFVHVTRVPTVTVSVAGWKPKSTMVTLAVFGAGVGVAGGRVAGGRVAGAGVAGGRVAGTGVGVAVGRTGVVAAEPEGTALAGAALAGMPDAEASPVPEPGATEAAAEGATADCDAPAVGAGVGADPEHAATTSANAGISRWYRCAGQDGAMASLLLRSPCR